MYSYVNIWKSKGNRTHRYSFVSPLHLFFHKSIYLVNQWTLSNVSAYKQVKKVCLIHLINNIGKWETNIDGDIVSPLKIESFVFVACILIFCLMPQRLENI